jgi:hypothetical protein
MRRAGGPVPLLTARDPHFFRFPRGRRISARPPRPPVENATVESRYAQGQVPDPA